VLNAVEDPAIGMGGGTPPRLFVENLAPPGRKSGNFQLICKFAARHTFKIFFSPTQQDLNLPLVKCSTKETELHSVSKATVTKPVC